MIKRKILMRENNKKALIQLIITLPNILITTKMI